MEYRAVDSQLHHEKVDEGRRTRRSARFKRHFRIHVETCGEQRKVLAAACDADAPQWSRWEGDHYRDRFPADELVPLTLESGPGLLEWIAREAGYGLMPLDRLPRVGITPESLGGLSSALAVKHGKVLGIIIQILEDGQISECEEAQLITALPDIVALKRYIGDLHDRVAHAADFGTGDGLWTA